MYSINSINIKYKISDKERLKDLDGFLFGRSHTINGVKVNNLIICDKNVSYIIIKKQIDKKYKKLILLLTELLISDDDSGTDLKLALNEIEKFRQIIKNKYRKYLKKNDLLPMSRKLSMLKKQVDTKIEELNISMKEELTKGTHR